MKKFVAVAALCAVPVMTFAATASASGDYPPDDSEVGTETEEICDGSAAAGELSDTGDGADIVTLADPGDNADTSEVADPGSDDSECGATSEETDNKAAAIAGESATAQPQSATASGQLPATGNDTSMFVRIGAMSVIAGGALVLVAWWRKRPSAA